MLGARTYKQVAGTRSARRGPSGGSRRAASRVWRRLRDSRGVSLPELLVSSALMLLALGAVLLLHDVAVKQQNRAEARARTQIDQTLAFQRMTRDLRQATRFFGTSGWNVLDFNAMVKSGDAAPAERHIRYECLPLFAFGPPDTPSEGSLGSCTRSEGPVGPGGAMGTTWDRTETVIRNMRNTFFSPAVAYEPNFTLTPAAAACPTRVALKFTVNIKNSLGQLTPDPRRPLVLEDAVTPRNPCTP